MDEGDVPLTQVRENSENANNGVGRIESLLDVDGEIGHLEPRYKHQREHTIVNWPQLTEKLTK